MKAILVIEIYDEEIPKEPVTAIRFSDGDYIYCNTKLKPMPERKYVLQGMRGYTRMVNECKGRNKCIDEILGEEE